MADFQQIRKIQKQILTAYERDFSKHAPLSIVPRIKALWNSIPAQLARENKKFIYGAIKESARAKDYELAIQWLIDCGLCYQIFNITTARYPLKFASNWFLQLLMDNLTIGVPKQERQKWISLSSVVMKLFR